MNKKWLKLFLLYFVVYLIIIPKIVNGYPTSLQGIILTIVSVGFLIVYILLNKIVFDNLLTKIIDIADNSIYVGIISIVLLFINITCSFFKMNLCIDNNIGYTSLINSYYINPIMVVCIVVCNPILEELVFKHVLFDQTEILKEKKILKIILISVVFSILHILNEILVFNVYALIDFINYFTFSIITFLSYTKTNNILYPIMIHMLCNGVAIYLI